MALVSPAQGTKRTAVDDFVAALFSEAVAGHIECRAIPSRGRAFYPVTQLYRVAEFVETQRSENVFVGMATRRDQSSGTLENCAQLGHLYTDQDFKLLAEPEARARLERFPFPPSMVVRSGGGLHAYWLLREPIELSTEEPIGRDALRRLAIALGADISVAECAHVLRVPGSFNYKYAPPARVVLEICAPGHRYNLSELLEFLPKEEPAAGDGGKARFAMPPSVGVGDRHLTLFRAGRSLKTRGLSPAAVLAALTVENTRVCAPPLSEAQVLEIVESVFQQKDRPGFEPEPVAAAPSNGGPPTAPINPATPFRLTDAGNAQRFAAQHAGHVHYCYAQKTWLVWDGTHWRRDPGDAIVRMAKEAARAIYVEAATATSEEQRKATGQWAAKSEDERRLRAMITLAQSEPGIPVTPDELDADPYLLNVANGTLHLKTGTLQPHRRADLITRIIPITYDAAAACPIWEGFLKHIFADKGRLITFVQRAIGYALTGTTHEQVIFIFWGRGANGKSTLLETTTHLLDPYAARIAAETLLARKGDALAMNDLFTLQGARFVVAIESDADRRLAESLVKSLTGGDSIKVKKLYADISTFKPAFKLFMATNHKPMIRGTDHAIWRRIRLVEFDVVIPDDQQDKELPTKLKAELPGILRWAVDGCRAWQAHGLGLPEEVRAAGEAYRQEQDTLGTFLAERCWGDPKTEVAFDALFDDYGIWAYRAKEKPLSAKKFSLALKERGLQQVKRATGRVWLGLRLRLITDPDSAGSGLVTGCDGLNGKPPSRGGHGEVYRNTRHNPSSDLNPSREPEDETSDCFDPPASDARP